MHNKDKDFPPLFPQSIEPQGPNFDCHSQKCNFSLNLWETHKMSTAACWEKMRSSLDEQNSGVGSLVINSQMIWQCSINSIWLTEVIKNRCVRQHLALTKLKPDWHSIDFYVMMCFPPGKASKGVVSCRCNKIVSCYWHVVKQAPEG